MLAAVLAVSATGKVADPAGTRDRLAAFGVPDSVAPGAARALPAAELLVAVLLVVPATRSFAGWAGTALLGAFTLAVGVTLGRGRRPPCPCFGSAGARPISGVTLVRNAVLLGLAVVATG